MANGKFTKTVTMSLIALAAATGAAVLEAGAAAADVATDSSGPPTVPGVRVPGLAIPALKIEQKVPALKFVPAIKIAQKIAALKIPGVIFNIASPPDVAP
jgi:hypothetical protein